MKNYLKKGDLRLGDFFYSATLEGLTIIEIKQGGHILFKGRFMDLAIKYYPLQIKYIYLGDNTLFIDVFSD